MTSTIEAAAVATEASTIQLRRGTASAWQAANPILAEGEEGLELGSTRRKIGDGVTRWNLLPYADRASIGGLGNADRLLAFMPPAAVADTPAGSVGVTMTHTTVAPSTTLVPATAAPVALRGGIYVPSGVMLLNTVNDPHPTIPAPVIEFDWTASASALLAVRLSNAAATNHGARVLVNGTPVAAGFTSVAVAAGGFSYVRLTAATAGTYRVRVEVALAHFAGIIHNPTVSAVTPATLRRLRAAFLGDSWAEGANGVTEPDLWPIVLARLLGTDCARMGQGSSGYIAAVTGWGARPYTDPTRLARLIAYDPHVVFVQGSQNDDNAGGPAIAAAAAATYRAIAGGLPDAAVFVIGPPRLDDPLAPRIANRDAVRAAAAGAPNVVGFIDQLDRPWLTGTGQAGTTDGSGTQDVLLSNDGAHPTLAGHSHFARWVQARTTELLLG